MSRTPTLNWHWVTGSSSCRVELCSDPDCAAPIQAVSVPGNWWIASPELPSGQLLYWRVRGNGDCDAAPWSDIWSFTTLCDEPPPPSSPQSAAPADESIDVPLDGPLLWYLVPEATGFLVEVCADETCATVVRSKSWSYDDDSPHPNNSWLIEPPLDDGIQYWWRVRWSNACGPGPWSSTTGNFTTTDCGPPGVPTLSDPGGSVASRTTHSLAWTAVADAVSYTVQESTDPGFPKLATTSTQIASTSTGFSHPNDGCTDTTWYYRVRANSDCAFGDWTSTVDMVVEATGILREATASTQWTVSPPLDEYERYTWKVKAHNACVAGPWSSVWDFQTSCQLPTDHFECEIEVQTSRPTPVSRSPDSCRHRQLPELLR